ncbi:chorismate synthase [Candidatus Peregrinibacteria bacterium]|nr:chorismate synthase [Candidatus Peregrinibacteria bacterium]
MNTFGHIFRVTIFGESHGGAVGCVIDGCPPKLKISTAEIEKELKRRATGQSEITSGRKEDDKVEILSGVENGVTLGTPICMIVQNKDAKPEDYKNLEHLYRPSHADFTYEKKYGIRSKSGGGRASARETTARVMAGVLAKKILQQTGIEILAYVSNVKNIETEIDPEKVTFGAIQKNEIRCPDEKKAKEMISLITKMKAEGNSVGGVITGIVKNCPIGLGEPVFDKLEADLAKALMSLPATKGFEIGSGFAGTHMTGKEHNDPFYQKKDGMIGTKTNNSGGIQGGISNGENIVLRVAFKPTSTISIPQETVDDNGKPKTLKNVHGRHDPCVLPRAVPIVEAMMAIVIADHYLRAKSIF